MKYVARELVNTAEGAALAPGEETSKDFDPKAERNAALIETGLLRPSESASEPPKASDDAEGTVDASKAQKAAEALGDGEGGGSPASGSLEDVERTPKKPAARRRAARKGSAE